MQSTVSQSFLVLTCLVCRLWLLLLPLSFVLLLLHQKSQFNGNNVAETATAVDVDVAVVVFVCVWDFCCWRYYSIAIVISDSSCSFVPPDRVIFVLFILLTASGEVNNCLINSLLLNAFIIIIPSFLYFSCRF